MLKLLRLTSGYIDTEDRFQFLGITEDETRITLWLTQRLLLRVIPPLLEWIEHQTPAQLNATAVGKSGNDMLQVFAQQAARANFKTTPAVSHDPQDRSALIRSVDVGRFNEGIRLIFKVDDEAVAGIVLDADQLRQWLDIIRRQWQSAGWPDSFWPQWLIGTDASASADEFNIAH